jgi:hypothetical protein
VVISGSGLRAFFHYQLRCLIIIDLKLNALTHPDADQLLTYLQSAAAFAEMRILSEYLPSTGRVKSSPAFIQNSYEI